LADYLEDLKGRISFTTSIIYSNKAMKSCFVELKVYKKNLKDYIKKIVIWI